MDSKAFIEFTEYCRARDKQLQHVGAALVRLRSVFLEMVRDAKSRKDGSPGVAAPAAGVAASSGSVVQQPLPTFAVWKRCMANVPEEIVDCGDDHTKIELVAAEERPPRSAGTAGG